MPSLAIIGTGISGLGCAHFLRHAYDVTLFEQNPHIGGHTHTIEVDELTGCEAPRRVPLDTGFMVFNHVTYPLLTRLFRALDVPTQPAPMSFSVRHADSGLEFAGSSLNHLFAQRRNLLRPRFWRMLAAIDRFNREAVAALEDPAVATETLGDYVQRRGYGADFFHLYLVPMSSAVWTTPPEQMLAFPAATLLRFFHNHGFLGLHTQHPWFTVRGGARTYVRQLTAPFLDRIRRNDPVTRVARSSSGIILTTGGGAAQTFDRVIFACHADQALSLLEKPTALEQRVLSRFRFQPNVATVHTDTSVMPRRRLAWSSWNYEIARDADARTSTATHYWMNSLQRVSERRNYFVTINRPEAIDPAKVLRRIAYEHPLFDLSAIAAQAELPRLQQAGCDRTHTFFVGAWQRYGFHEDGLWSAHRLSGLLLGRDPWPVASEPLVAVAR